MLIIIFVALLLFPNHSLTAGLVHQREECSNEISTSGLLPEATVNISGVIQVEPSAACPIPFETGIAPTTLPSPVSQTSNRTCNNSISLAWGRDINKTSQTALPTAAPAPALCPSSLKTSTVLPSSLIYDLNPPSTASSFIYSSSSPPKATASVVSFTGSGARPYLGPSDVFIVLLIGVVRIMA
jgi:hypothetical protein